MASPKREAISVRSLRGGASEMIVVRNRWVTAWASVAQTSRARIRLSPRADTAALLIKADSLSLFSVAAEALSATRPLRVSEPRQDVLTRHTP